MIGADGYRINPTTVEAAQTMVTPENAGQLQQFLASCNWLGTWFHTRIRPVSRTIAGLAERSFKGADQKIG